MECSRITAGVDVVGLDKQDGGRGRIYIITKGRDHISKPWQKQKKIENAKLSAGYRDLLPSVLIH